ncbi:Mitochondrial assembly of ribosomal large subunit protein 1 [Platysternon megacephalum]|uniref:Mitochondrial assembly of ribosomal large subunit protein 1 n=1 Tax=Platysternon megacephalum TaxID=55544 RepID=A0A4D9EA40_9SAUR|nr:Mitochondrial assembly of ribosomal large subunit protein 1 [Platysternon megacephalum]
MWRGSRWLRGLVLPAARGLRLRPAGPAPGAAVRCAPCWAGLAGRALGGGPSAELRAGGGAEQERRAPDHALSKFNIDLIISLLRQENASNICVIQVPPEMRYSDYFIIVSGSSSRHIHAMAHYMLKMYKQLKQEHDPHIQIEGKDTDDWMCIDFGSIVIHFMLPETREIYELEKLWTLRSYDDQLAQMVPESLPDDFIFGLTHQQQ